MLCIEAGLADQLCDFSYRALTQEDGYAMHSYIVTVRLQSPHIMQHGLFHPNIRDQRSSTSLLQMEYIACCVLIRYTPRCCCLNACSGPRF